MITSTTTVLAAIVVAILTGILGGWLLRCRFQNRSAGNNFARRRDDGFNTSETPLPDFPSTAKDPIDGETAEPCVRNTFSLALGHRLAESARRGETLSILLVCVDNIQEHNGQNNVRLGNETLDAIGKVLLASVRAMDWVARFDLTTFAFLLPNATHPNAVRVGERFQKNVSAAQLSIRGKPSQFTLSIGATASIAGDNSKAILRRAEEAMLAAIEDGGNCIRSQVVESAPSHTDRETALIS